MVGRAERRVRPVDDDVLLTVFLREFPRGGVGCAGSHSVSSVPCACLCV